MDHAADKPKIKRGDSKKRLSTHGIRGGGAGAVARGGGEYKASRKGKKQASQDPCVSSGTVVLANICKFDYTSWWIMFLDML